MLAPVFYIVQALFEPVSEGWREFTTVEPNDLYLLLPAELREEFMPESSLFHQRLNSTLIVLSGVLTLSSFVGISAAWLVSMWQFPGRKWLGLLLALPMTIPTYVMATAYKLLTVEAELNSRIWMRDVFGASAMQSFDTVWNYVLCIFTLSAAYYPYVYLAACSAFLSVSSRYMESATSLGSGYLRNFYKIILPLSRPAIVGGLTLVGLETLNEYGAMKIMGIETLLTEIFRLRAGANDLNTAIRVSACILTIVVVMLLFEQWARRGRKFHQARNTDSSFKRPQLSKGKGIACVLVLLSCFLLAFALPLYQLIEQAYYGLGSAELRDFLPPVKSSLLIASQAALLVLGVSLFLSYAERLIPKPWMHILTKLSGSGYTVPGAILGIAIITWTGSLLQNSGNTAVSYIFYQSTYGLVIAYAIRFMTVGLQPIQAGLQRVRIELDEASMMMGVGRVQSFFRVHLPLLRPAILSASLILFLDVLKELPLTLILSPFNTETLATQTYSLFAVQEEYSKGSIAALFLIASGVIGMIAIRLMNKHIGKS